MLLWVEKKLCSRFHHRYAFVPVLWTNFLTIHHAADYVLSMLGITLHHQGRRHRHEIHVLGDMKTAHGTRGAYEVRVKGTGKKRRFFALKNAKKC